MKKFLFFCVVVGLLPTLATADPGINLSYWMSMTSTWDGKNPELSGPGKADILPRNTEGTCIFRCRLPIPGGVRVRLDDGSYGWLYHGYFLAGDVVFSDYVKSEGCQNWYRIRRARCGNPATGEYPVAFPVTAKERKLCSTVECEEEEREVEIEAKRPCYYPSWCPPTRLSQCGYTPAKLERWDVTDRHKVDVYLAFFEEQECHRGKEENTCPGINPPNKPPTEGPVGNPTGPDLKPLPYPGTGNTAIEYGTGGMAWDPGKMSHWVADPVN